MLRARAGQRIIFSHARDRARPQACTRWRRGPEYRRHGCGQPGRQLEYRTGTGIRRFDHATITARPNEKWTHVPWPALSRLDDHEQRIARARIYLPLRRPRNAGYFAATKIRFAPVTDCDERRTA